MKTARSISAIALALLVLMSSTSFMVGMHVCMGKVKNIAWFTKADSCEQEQKLPPCHRHKMADCCDDETIVHKSDDLKTTIESIKIVASGPVDTEQSLVLIAEIIPSAETSRAQYFDYDPPLPSWDRNIEHQVFLI